MNPNPTIRLIVFLLVVSHNLVWASGDFERFSIHNGLAHTHVLCVFQDSNGLMWIGTYAGLHQFDGYNFRNYKYSDSDSTSLSNNAVNVIYENKKGQLWIGTEGGLNLFDPVTGHFERLLHNPTDSTSLSHNIVKTIYQDQEGTIWVGTYGGGLNAFNPSTQKFKRFQNKSYGLPNDGFERINAFMATSPGKFWVGTEKSGLYLFDAVAHKVLKHHKSLFPNATKSSVITDIVRHKSGAVYVGTWSEGLFLLDESAKSFIPVRYCAPDLNNPGLSNIRSIEEDSQGNLWLAHFGSGITRLDTQTGEYRQYSYEKNDLKSLSNDHSWALTIDKTDNLWVGTFGGGLCRMSLNQYAIPMYTVPKQGGGQNNTINAIYQTRRGEILLGSFSSKLIQYDHSKGEFLHIPLPGAGGPRSIIIIYEDKRERVWVGTDFGLFKLDSSRSEITHYVSDQENPNSIEDAPIFSIVQDDRDNLWIGTWNGGLQMLSAENSDLRNSQNAQFVKYQHDPDDPSTISSNIINSLHCGERNELWIGTSSYLEKLDLNTGTFTKISDVIANSILQDKSGHFWIATPSDGLFQMNAQGQVLKEFNGLGDLSLSTVSNLLNPIILGMARHPDSTIWITTNEGLSIFDPAGNMFSHFTLDDLNQSGLSLHSVNNLASGEVLIGGVDGFNIITPDRLNSSHQINEVLITDLKVGGRSVLYDLNNDGFQGQLKREENYQTLTLSHQERALSISYSVIEYNAPDKINFAYRLEGFEDEWNYTSAHFRQAQYPGLPPGSYQLWLKATNSRGEWGKAAVKLKIVVTPPYWATWWFRLLFAIAMGALIVLLVRLRTRQLHLHQKNLQKLIDHKTAELSKKGEQLQLQNLELQSQKNEILRISEQIKQANENKMEFFTSISHEFRTPLTLILGPIEQLKARIRESDKREVGHFLTAIEKNGFRLLRLINDILDFRKIDTGNMKIICVKADIMPFLDHLIEAFREIASRKAIELSFEKSTHGYECWFDPGKLEIICFNLLSNAFHYTPSGGKVTLVVNIDDRKKCISLEVRDTGIGMNESELDHVFNRFYQVGNGISDSKGSGIGLSLTKDVVEIQRGHITVHSLPEKGTTFSVELPMFDPENEDNQNVVFNKFGSPEPNLGLAANLTGELNAAGSSPVKPPKSAAKRQDVILIVEDDLDMQRYLQSCLEHTYKILLASNGEEGLEIAKKEQPHLILSDVMMPKMTGLDLCQKVKQDFTISHIPVVLLSAQTAYETQLDGYDKGADGFIGKPFHQGLLLAKLGSVLASKERLFLKFKNEKILEPSEITVTSVDEEFVTRAKEIVEKNMDNSDFEVQDMISELGMSRTLLHMKLKKLMNCSTTDFIRGLRMKRASQLLRSGNYRVAEVCYMVGYNDPQNFSKVFRQHFGQTPSDHKSQQT